MKDTRALMRLCRSVTTLAILTTSCFAQSRRLDVAEVAALEEGLTTKPTDVEARPNLLRYYTYQALPVNSQSVESRRKLVLWLIRNRPDASVLAEPAGTLDAGGSPFSDPQGYAQAAAAWQPALLARADVRYALKRFDDAISDRDDVVRLKPDLAMAYHRRGLAYSDSGRHQGAAGYEVEIDHLFPDGRWASEVAGRRAAAYKVTTPEHRFQFVGAQPVRWRVWAVAPVERIPLHKVRALLAYGY